MASIEPIDNVKWVDVDTLNPNDYNPNVVLNQEMKLLKFSILKTGWIQPVLISKDGVIIDGYHRYWLSKNDKDIRKKYGGRCPCCTLNLNEAERKLLTVRINRAKGNHVAVKMHELVTSVIGEHGYPVEQVAESIGATKEEIDVLLKENVFEAMNIKRHKYSRAWVPK